MIKNITWLYLNPTNAHLFGFPMKSAEIVMPATLVAYFLLLIYISRRVSRKSVGGGNDDFFRAGHSSPWWMVAVGMVGASISGVTFMSVPGWAAATGMT